MLSAFDLDCFDGDQRRRTALGSGWSVRFEDVPPVRGFRWNKGDRSFAGWYYAVCTLALMHDAGVKITAGSDVAMLMPSPPVALLRELQLLAKAGLPLPAVLAAGTRHSAEKIGQQATTPGTITVGSIADALLLDADPYVDIAHLVDRSHHIGTLRAGRPSWDEDHPRA
ncbi:hypothetical protein [Streptomyces decoyicus]|uniref:hypothetical protein n=1 Tax=Streptomyces decoyicus TaxID=249567 RepID=UPI0033B70455